jgi:hypothetical protein
MIRLANRWIRQFARNKIDYQIQYHVDHDIEALKEYWAGIVEINPAIIRGLRKSTSGQLARRQFRSQYGLLSIHAGDTYLRARLQAWMNTVKA